MPMPKEVVDRVHHIADRQKVSNRLIFTRLDGTPYLLEDDEVSIQESDDDESNDEGEESIIDDHENDDPDAELEEFQDAAEEIIEQQNNNAQEIYVDGMNIDEDQGEEIENYDGDQLEPIPEIEEETIPNDDAAPLTAPINVEEEVENEPPVTRSGRRVNPPTLQGR